MSICLSWQCKNCLTEYSFWRVCKLVNLFKIQIDSYSLNRSNEISVEIFTEKLHYSILYIPVCMLNKKNGYIKAQLFISKLKFAILIGIKKCNGLTKQKLLELSLLKIIKFQIKKNYLLARCLLSHKRNFCGD